MATTILTPTTVWGQFTFENEITAEVVSEKISRGLVYTSLYIDGRKVGRERVRIFAISVKKADLETAPAVIIAQKKCDGMDTSLASDLAKKGFHALIVDFAGKASSEEHFTIYPEGISYANYDEEKVTCTELDKNANQSCWYEWANVMLYAYKYLQKQKSVTRIGAIAIEDFANALWQASAVAKKLSGAVIISNAGYLGYKGINKFAEAEPPMFSDDAVRYIAGVDSQSYAMHVKCPLFLVSPTNSPSYDVDRAYDTISATSTDVYTAVDYSVGNRYAVDHKCYQNILTFFEKTLKNDGNKIDLPSETLIKADFSGGKIILEIENDKNNLKNLVLYSSEDSVVPELRTWQIHKAEIKNEKGNYVFEYVPFKGSSIVTFFARSEYENGFQISSNVVCKKLNVEDFEGSNRQRILYSSRIEDGRKFFSPYQENENKPTGIAIDSSTPTVVEKKGALDMMGLYARGGLLTFKIGAKKYKPNDDEMMMLDFYIKEGGTAEVSLICDFYGEKITFIARSQINAGVWQNIKFNLADFKSPEGRPLKTYEKVDAVSISATSEFLINNVLWV